MNKGISIKFRTSSSVEI